MQVSHGDWSDFFAQPGVSSWGSNEWVPALEQLTPGDMVLAYQTDRNELVGLAKVDSFRRRGRHRDLYLESLEHIGAKVRPLKKVDPRIAAIPALQPGRIQTLYPISAADAKALLRAARAAGQGANPDSKLRFEERQLLGRTGVRQKLTKNTSRVVYFNNCHNRDHVALFGSGAFFDLGTSGRQGSQARNLPEGQLCVVAERARSDEIAFHWYSFAHETLLRDEQNRPDRVFFGRILATDVVAKSQAAGSVRYKALFKANGDLKNGSVFHHDIPTASVPAETTVGRHDGASRRRDGQVGGGFGNQVENKFVESAAIRAVIRSYKADGWSVRSVERERCGYDLECSRLGDVDNVEVKGVRGPEPCFIITTAEVEQARSNPSFVLFVVTEALTSSRKLKRFSGREFCRRFDLSAIQYRANLKH
jgi:hypothetical protein